MINYLRPIAVLGSITLIGYNSPAIAGSQTEIQQIATQRTVQISKCAQGSGAIIQKNGNTYTVLTVAQGIRRSGCEIVTPDQARYQVAQIKTLPNNVDLAVMTFSSNKNYPIAKIIDNSDRLKAGEAIYVSGFTTGSTSRSAIFTFAPSEVVANPPTVQQGKGYSLIYSNNPCAGVNGSPVWNNQGELIAIHGPGDLDTKTSPAIDATVRAQTGYNLGIAINTFTRLASASGINGYKPVAIAAKPNPVDDLMANSVLKERKGDHQGMLADLEQAILLDSQNPRISYGRAIAKTILGNSDAISDYNFALSLNLNEPLFYDNRGIAKAKFGDNAGAITDFDRAIGLHPDRAATHYHRGMTKLAQAKQKAGLDNLNQAIALDPNLALAYYSRSLVKAKLGDQKGGIEDLNRTIALNPNYVEAHYRLGLVKLGLGESKGAIESFTRAIILSPKNPEIYHDRGVAKTKLGDKKGAIEDYTRAIALDQNQARSYTNRGLVKSKLGDKSGAIVDLNQAAARYKLQRQTASYNRVIAEIKRIEKKK
jgi:tetratricopeptide (TPR) repeat protein